MQGANEYARIIPTGQYGRLWCHAGSHARGRTFHIYLLPAGVELSAGQMGWTVEDSVEVYGIRGGNPGWTEWYGWIHEGPWVKDFEDLVMRRRQQIADARLERERKEADEKTAESARIKSLLANY